VNLLPLAVAAAGLVGSLFLSPSPALAHERRDVGPYQFTVGFIGEPALEGEPNGIDLRIVDKASQKPVEGAEKTLKAAVAFGGGQAKEFPLRARFGQPGAYTADLIPTRAGSYVFTFTGTIDGQNVNEKFESGPGRFNDVITATDLQFPVANPSASQLQQQLADARQQASTANTMAMAGLAAGVLGLLLAAYALFSRRSAGAARPAQTKAVAQGSGADSGW
jgi:hypothetical protein